MCPLQMLTAGAWLRPVQQGQTPLGAQGLAADTVHSRGHCMACLGSPARGRLEATAR